MQREEVAGHEHRTETFPMLGLSEWKPTVGTGSPEEGHLGKRGKGKGIR
jgi:hypothetical protein